MKQVKVWVHPQEMSQINKNGYPNSYSLQFQTGLVEMTISSNEFEKWQRKEGNSVEERVTTRKQLLKG